MGLPGLAPGIYFRLLLVGYFEGIDSELGISWLDCTARERRKLRRLSEGPGAAVGNCDTDTKRSGASGSEAEEEGDRLDINSFFVRISASRIKKQTSTPGC